MAIEKQKWNLPSVQDGTAFMVRSTKAEEHLRQALDLLHHVKKTIPQTPASETKSEIEILLSKFK